MVSKRKARARNSSEKIERRQAILAAAIRIWRAADYSGLTMATLADRVGLSKGALYLYFRSKEELVHALLEEQLEQWVTHVQLTLAAMRPQTTDGVAAVFADSLVHVPDLVQLLSILEPILEARIDQESVIRFRCKLLQGFKQVGTALEECLPGIRPIGGLRVLLHIRAQMTGVQMMKAPAGLRQAIAVDPELASTILSNQDFLAGIRALLTGFSSSEMPMNLHESSWRSRF
jgi:TetR/AcrR family transcriptional regulator